MNEIQKQMSDLGWQFCPVGRRAWFNGHEYEKKDGLPNPNFEKDYALVIGRIKGRMTC